MCFHVWPTSALRNAPSRLATRICSSGVTVNPRMLVRLGGSPTCCQSVSPFLETRTSVRVARTSIFPLDCTEMKSFLPRTAPPLQLFPLFALLKSPMDVAASHRWGVISISLILASNSDCVVNLGAVDVLVFFELPGRGEGSS